VPSAGTYNVTVTALAQAQQLLSKPHSPVAPATVGTGTLTLTLGTHQLQCHRPSAATTRWPASPRRSTPPPAIPASRPR
jgi:flagellar capping protein FliD